MTGPIESHSSRVNFRRRSMSREKRGEAREATKLMFFSCRIKEEKASVVVVAIIVLPTKQQSVNKYLP